LEPGTNAYSTKEVVTSQKNPFPVAKTNKLETNITAWKKEEK
jgi:hypothetical protein